MNFYEFFWPFPLRSLLLDAAYPLAMLVVLLVMIRTLLTCAREAEQNWVTDP
jgi:hypothetical protein